ncbi:MAG: aminoacyl-tRNA hydrolase [Acidobacteriia bacterium]|nr:aminoacyl-tRNA hydrolase [Terriglobia bacterium]MYG02661.1 aminoacyl-tRNA hydrolase [Terriglobia bacterium]MYK09082.1 aminoacyl-tRNA hydrolase [Terriglobia bacterium]
MFWRRAVPEDADWLIVGLGNPGEEYRQTPHNLGFLTVERLSEDAGVRVTRPEEDALVGSGQVGGKQALLAKPLSFVNRSGGPVKRLLRRYDLTPRRLLVVYDELDLAWGRLRLKQKGSAAGHNGMQSIIDALGTSEFPRLRIGIHPGHPVSNGARYVLRPFTRDEIEEVEQIVGRAAEVVRHALAEGTEKAMARSNRRLAESQE